MLKLLNKFFQIFTDILVFIVTILIFFSLYNLVSIKVLHKPYASLLGYSVFEIASGSMEPTIKVKDLIVVKITKDIKENDIVTYDEDSNLITHRVIAINDEYITTKGDANNSVDVKVKREQIVGKTVHIIKKGGIIRDIFVTPKIIITIIITLILINYCFSLVDDKLKKQDNANIEIKNSNKSFQDLKNEVLKNKKSKRR